jgi:hypothetical protein
MVEVAVKPNYPMAIGVHPSLVGMRSDEWVMWSI